LPGVIGLDRRKIRRRFEERFSATRMAMDYVDVYHALLAREQSPALYVNPDMAPDLAVISGP
jgi:hypothetical protein